MKFGFHFYTSRTWGNLVDLFIRQQVKELSAAAVLFVWGEEVGTASLRWRCLTQGLQFSLPQPMTNTQGPFRSGPWRWHQIPDTVLNAVAVRWSELNLELKPTCYFLITASFNMSFEIRKAYVQISVTNLLLEKRTFWALLLAGGKVTTGL